MRDAALAGHEFDEERLAYLLAPLAARNGYPKAGWEGVRAPPARRARRGTSDRAVHKHDEGRPRFLYRQPRIYRAALAEMEEAIASAMAISTPTKVIKSIEPISSAVTDAPIDAMPRTPALADAINRVVLPPPEVLESLNSTIRSLNSLYDLQRRASDATAGRDADTAGADDSAAGKPADSGDAFPEQGGEDHAE